MLHDSIFVFVTGVSPAGSYRHIQTAEDNEETEKQKRDSLKRRPIVIEDNNNDIESLTSSLLYPESHTDDQQPLLNQSLRSISRNDANNQRSRDELPIQSNTYSCQNSTKSSKWLENPSSVQKGGKYYYDGNNLTKPTYEDSKKALNPDKHCRELFPYATE